MFEYGIRRAALYHTTIGPGSNFIQYAHTHTHRENQIHLLDAAATTLVYIDF